MDSHEAAVAAYADDDGVFLEVVCECSAILLESEEDEDFLPFSEISSAVREHQEKRGG